MSDEVLKNLKDRYCPRRLLEYIKSKYGTKNGYSDVKNEDNSISNNVLTTTEKSYFVYGKEKEKDIEEFNKLVQKVALLKESLGNIIDLKDQKNIVYSKIIGSCLDDLKNLQEDIEDLSGEDIAKKIVNIIEHSLMKCFSVKKLGESINKHLLECGFQVVDFSIGHVIKNEDIKYIGMPLRREVDDEKKVNRILNKTYDAYTLKYMCEDEEDVIYSAVICGKYEVGVRKE